MKYLFVILVSAFIGGCATSPNSRGIDPTCNPRIGMSESTFFKCACIRPLLYPDGGISLISTSESRFGIVKIYSCSRFDGDITAYFNNGILSVIHR